LDNKVFNYIIIVVANLMMIYFKKTRYKYSFENCDRLSYYAANSGKFFTDVSGQNFGPIFSVQDSKYSVPF